ncbi:MAG: hypothetical protein WAT92_11575 [Saprospiraceae bacterium]
MNFKNHSKPTKLWNLNLKKISLFNPKKDGNEALNKTIIIKIVDIFTDFQRLTKVGEKYFL